VISLTATKWKMPTLHYRVLYNLLYVKEVLTFQAFRQKSDVFLVLMISSDVKVADPDSVKKLIRIRKIFIFQNLQLFIFPANFYQQTLRSKINYVTVIFSYVGSGSATLVTGSQIIIYGFCQ